MFAFKILGIQNLEFTKYDLNAIGSTVKGLSACTSQWKTYILVILGWLFIVFLSKGKQHIYTNFTLNEIAKYTVEFYFFVDLC